MWRVSIGWLASKVALERRPAGRPSATRSSPMPHSSRSLRTRHLSLNALPAFRLFYCDLSPVARRTNPQRRSGVGVRPAFRLIECARRYAFPLTRYSRSFGMRHHVLTLWTSVNRRRCPSYSWCHTASDCRLLSESPRTFTDFSLLSNVTERASST